MDWFPAPKSRTDFKIALICALPLESDAVLDVFTKRWFGNEYGKAEGDTNAYTTGHIGHQNVVLVHMPGMGKTHAASVAASLRSSFTGIELAIVVGICGIVPYTEDDDELILGDVVISEGCVQYDLGRRYEDAFLIKDSPGDALARPDRRNRSHLSRLKTQLYGDLLQSRTDHHYNANWNRDNDYPGAHLDKLFPAIHPHKHQDPAKCHLCGKYRKKSDPVCSDSRKLSCHELGCDEHPSIPRARHAHHLSRFIAPPPRVHFGLFGSADTVLRSAQDRDGLAKRYGVIAFEMETAGIWDSFPCVAIKGACDYADSHKSKEWQVYAARNAAAYMKAFLEQMSPLKNQPPATGLEALSSQPAFMIPFDRDADFVGRNETLSKIAYAFENRAERVALSGIGGVGKSQIAIEYCYRYKSNHPNAHVFWVHAGSRTKFENDYLEIAKYLKIDCSKSTATSALESTAKNLGGSSIGSWLMVLDGADSDELVFGEKRTFPHRGITTSESPIIRYIPQNTTGAILITTRNVRVAWNFGKNNSQQISVPNLGYGDATGLLRVKSDDDVDWNEPQAQDIVESLGCLPLAITQAAAYINQEGVSLEHYLGLLQNSSTEKRLLMESYYNPRRDPETPNAVFLTWQLSFDEILSKNQRAADILSQMAFLDRISVPSGLLREEGDNQVVFDKAIGTLKAYSFVSEERGTKLYNVHHLVQGCVQVWLDLRQRTTEYQSRALQSISRAYPQEGDSDFWEAWQILKPHAEIAVEHEIAGSQSCHRSSVLINLAKYDIVQGRSELAAQRAETAFDRFKVVNGESHPKTLHAMNVLFIVYQSCGDWPKAKKMGEDVARTTQSILGKDHPHTINAISNLLRVYAQNSITMEVSGKMLKAACERIERRMQHSGEPRFHAQLDLDRYFDALQRESHSLSANFSRAAMSFKDKCTSPKEHSLAMNALENLGDALLLQGKYKEAEPILEELYQLQEKSFGRLHLETIITKLRLANVLLTIGRTQEGRAALSETINHTTLVFSERGRDINVGFRTFTPPPQRHP